LFQWFPVRILIATFLAIPALVYVVSGWCDWYRNPVTGVSQPVPRHREIKDHLARNKPGDAVAVLGLTFSAAQAGRCRRTRLTT
jgi:hypothetical protein